MSGAKRGGLTLKTGKIGRVNCLRQQLTMPGERLNVSINGKVRLESLRERDVMRINAHLAVFWQPLRWLWPEYPQYIKDGPNGILTPPVAQNGDWARIGIGASVASGAGDYLKCFEDSYLNIFNRWYKWPEGSDITTIGADGEAAVPLSKTWSRCRFSSEPENAADYQVASATTADVRDIAEVQAKFRGAMKREVFAYERWQELVDEVYRGDGSREVDKVPMMLDSTQVGVNPREIPATDGASLGQWQSLFDFQVDHQIRGITSPEHGILSYMLVLRFASVTESKNPLAATIQWEDLAADPEWLSSARPEVVKANDLYQTAATTEFGYLPAGWKWRCDSDVIGARVDARDSFPYMLVPLTQSDTKDATRIKDAFRSQALGDYMVDVFIDEKSQQPIGDAMDSYMSGMMDDASPRSSGRNDEFPKTGKML